MEPIEYVEEAVETSAGYIMQMVEYINGLINNFVWGPVMLLLLVGTGVYFTVRLKVFQVTKIGLWMKMTFGKLFTRQKAGKGAITPFQALTTALAATVGTGNMVGVATAIVAGGPGAVFWMWISAFFGMMTKYAEIVLSLNFRRRNEKGEWVGGPMYYLREGAEIYKARSKDSSGAKWFFGKVLWVVMLVLSIVFAVFGALAAFGIGNMTQVNSIASSVETLFDEFGWIAAPVDSGFPLVRLVVGIFLAIVAGLVIIGGLKRIGRVTEAVVPFMCLVFVCGGIVALVINHESILPAFQSIFAGAFNIRSAAGGVLGYIVAGPVRYGLARGVFSNEAGLGSAPIAHAAADTDHPVKQGMWGVFEVFMDTLVICTFTALVVLTSGAYTPAGDLNGAPLTIAAFQTSFGSVGTLFVTLCITLFAFSTLLSWSLYGQRCFEYLFKGNAVKIPRVIYQMLFIFAIVLASVMQLELVWDIADTLNGLMAIPNLCGLLVLSGIVAKLTKEFLALNRQSKLQK